MPADREIRVKNLRHNIRYQDLFKVKAQKLIWHEEKEFTKDLFKTILGKGSHIFKNYFSE